MANASPDFSSPNRGFVNDAFLNFSAAVSLLSVGAVFFGSADEFSASVLDVGFFAIACCSLLNLSDEADRISTRSTHREARRDATFEHRTARGGSNTTPLGTEQLGQSQVPRCPSGVRVRVLMQAGLAIDDRERRRRKQIFSAVVEMPAKCQ